MPLTHLLRRATADPPADAVLLGRFAATRDEAAFAELVRRHGPLVRGVCRRMLGEADADDASQAVFLVLLRNAGRVRNADPLSGWLHGVSVRVCKKALARRPQPVARPATAPPDPADAAGWREVGAAIDAALARLPDKLRQPLVLCFLLGLTRDEAAARLDWTVPTLRGRLDRGRARLRADLQRRGFGLPAGLLAVLLTAAPSDAVWTAGVVRGVFDPAGPPAAVLALTVGVGWAMRTKLLLGAGLPLVAAGGLLAVADGPKPEPPPKAEPAPMPANKPAEAKPPATSAAPSLVGTWENIDQTADATVRSTTRRTFRADGTCSSRMVVTGAAARTSVWTGTYTLTGQSLTLTSAEVWQNDEPKPGFAGEQWQEQVVWGKADGKLILYTARGGQDSMPRRFLPVPPDPADAVASSPSDRRPPTKEPAYQGKPLYLELMFGPTAAVKVWLVVDGRRAFLDRNADGDLTNDGPAADPVEPPRSPPPAGPKPPEVPLPEVNTFHLGTVRDPARNVSYGEIVLTVTAKPNRLSFAAVRLRVNGGRTEMAGTGSLLLSAKASAARRLHFDAGRLVLQPFPMPDRLVGVGGKYELHARLGTPGVGRDTFVARSLDDLPDDKHPVAVLKPEGFAAGPKLPLTERQTDADGVWSVFVRPLTSSPFKQGAAKVTLSFPDCPLGPVEPATYEVWERR